MPMSGRDQYRAEGARVPIRQIVENAGVEGSIVVGSITENSSPTYGFNAQTEQYVDMLDQRGIVDPAKVVRAALQDAASVAGLLITTEAMVAEVPKRHARHADGRRRRHGWHGLLRARALTTTTERAASAALFVCKFSPEVAFEGAPGSSRVAALGQEAPATAPRVVAHSPADVRPKLDKSPDGVQSGANRVYLGFERIGCDQPRRDCSNDG